MTNRRSFALNMRIVHRYLGFFLAGIMAVYSLSGIVLIFRDSDFLKQEKLIEKKLESGLDKETLGQQLKIKNLKVEREEGTIYYFKNGSYDKNTGIANYTVKRLPTILDKMTHFHKAKSGDPLFFLNIFFGFSLFFFVVSAFWMFMPKTTVFKKGIYFTLAGIAFTLLLLFV